MEAVLIIVVHLLNNAGVPIYAITSQQVAIINLDFCEQVAKPKAVKELSSEYVKVDGTCLPLGK
ncbi:hypothetical protein C4556_02900 [Candidatus Parcubacteria bacterium]|nr:MAG: hypothetical protein C4556_02900 [Candidatus Parcubacteria bacterium]